MPNEINAGETSNEITPGQGETPNGNNQASQALRTAQADVTRLQGELDRWQALGATPEAVQGRITTANNQAAGERHQSKDAREVAETLKTLGLSVDDVKRIKGEHDTWGAERRRDAKLKSLLEATGVAKVNGKLLASLAGALDDDYLTEGEGETKTAYAQFKDGDKDVKKPLLERLGERYPDLKEQLFTGQGSQSGGVSNTPTSPANAWVSQGVTGGAGDAQNGAVAKPASYSM